MRWKKATKIVIVLVVAFGSVGIVQTIARPWIPGPLPHEFTCKGYVYDHMGNPLNYAKVELFNSGGSRVDYDYTNSNGYYSMTIYTYDYSTYKIQAKKTSFETSPKKSVYSSGTKNINFYIATTVADKIGVFFYASDAIESSSINKYSSYLRYDEGFDNVYKYQDVPDWDDAMNYIDSIEHENDFLLIYIAGHGTYLDDEDNSLVRVNPGTQSRCLKTMEPTSEPQTVDIKSNELSADLNNLESKNILVVVESCFSGGFYYDLRYKSGVQVITSTDRWNPAYFYHDMTEINYPQPDEGYFSHYFFQKIYNGASDAAAFSYAESLTEANRAPQNPMRYDGTPYTWFLNW